MDNLAIQELRKLVDRKSWSYRISSPNASEPAAFTCLALNAYGFVNEAVALAKWLEKIQTSAGSIGVTAEEEKPAWPTSLAILAWLSLEQSGAYEFRTARKRAIDWLLQAQGKRLERRRQIEHDTTILGWSWAENTHSWLEPTCFSVLALQAAGLSDHQRTRDGIAMIVDRLHQTGGCNYGNTVVLGQSTLPHLQPSGLAMLAIADIPIEDPRVDRTLDYLEASISKQTATASLCFALLGLASHNRRPKHASTLIGHAIQRDQSSKSQSCYKIALACLAALENQKWLPNVKNQMNSLAVHQ